MRLRALLGLGLVGILMLAACGDDSSSNTDSGAPSTEASSAAAPAATGGDVAQPGYGIPADLTQPAAGGASGGLGTVTAQNVAFNPAELTVKVGDTITFTNADDFEHTFTANDGEFDSGRVDGGGSFEYTADAAGSIAFHCNIHTNMKGTITVEA
jgi:plastocyanin